MVEKLKSQLEAAQKAKEIHAVRKKEHEAAKSKQVGKSPLATPFAHFGCSVYGSAVN